MSYINFKILFQKKSTEAVLPFRAGDDEVGWDLTLISIHKIIDENTIMFDTGIAVRPPKGFYTEIVPRSSIYKYGWMMANSIGIIDPTYRDTLKIVLVRINPSAPDIQLPCRIAQLIVRQMSVITESEEVKELDETYRKGGFGSTGT